ncbi:MAG: hypothetical protein RL208_532 [Pseudomonadota bacterium]|jgi:cell pole-organizing protein PopZ
MFGLKKKTDSTQSMLSEIKQKITGNTNTDATSSNQSNVVSNGEFNEDAFLLSQLEDNKVANQVSVNNNTSNFDEENLQNQSNQDDELVNFDTQNDKNTTIDDDMYNQTNDEIENDDEDEFLKMGEIINQENIKNDANNKIVEEENNHFENEVINNVDDILISKNTNTNLTEQEKNVTNKNNNYNVDASYLNIQSVKNNATQLTPQINNITQPQEQAINENKIKTTAVSAEQVSLSKQNETKVQIENNITDIQKPQIKNNSNINQNATQAMIQSNLTQNLATQPTSTSISESVKEQTKHSIEDLMNVVKNQIIQSKANSDNMMNKTMDEFIRSIIEPKIITFLDRNLPQIVNNVVEKEIQKIIRDNKTN